MIYLMRHGQDDEAYIGGWSSVSLIDKGRREVYEKALWIRDNLNIERIISSDVFRAKETSFILNDVLNVPVSFSTYLREQSKGVFNGRLKSSLSEEEVNFINGVGVDTVFPGGESLRGLYERVKVYMSKLRNLDDSVLLVTHRGFINMIYFLLYKQELSMDKERFGVDTASLHEFDRVKLMIRKMVEK